MAALYAAGVAMGFSPNDIDRMSMWQFSAACAGFAQMHQSGGPRLTEAEKAELVEWLNDDLPARELKRLAVWAHDEAGRPVLARHVVFH